MQNQKIQTKPVQLEPRIHQALKEQSAVTGVSMGNLIKVGLMIDKDFREILKKVPA